MSTDTNSDGLTDRDRAVFQVASDGEEGEPATEHQLQRLREKNRALEEEVQDLRDELTATKKTLYAELNEIKDELRGRDTADPRSTPSYEDLTTLEKYQRMSEAERADLLGPSDRRAVLIFENWSNWATAVDAGQLISTNLTRGKNGRTAISADLQTATGDHLAANEIYRAMKAVATLSGSRDDVEETTDEYGRDHIYGGAFEYHDKVNSDASGTDRKYKVLKLVDPDAVTFP